MAVNFLLKGVNELEMQRIDIEAILKHFNSAEYQLSNVPESEKLKKPILTAKKKYEKKLKAVRLKLEKIQENCNHGNWIYLGRDSHYNHEQCGLCGYIDYKA